MWKYLNIEFIRETIGCSQHLFRSFDRFCERVYGTCIVCTEVANRADTIAHFTAQRLLIEVSIRVFIRRGRDVCEFNEGNDGRGEITKRSSSLEALSTQFYFTAKIIEVAT